MFTTLQYTNFNATITYSGRPKNVLQFVKNTKPRAGDYVDKISARYKGFTLGASHTRNVGFRFHQNVNANTAKNIKWSSIEFLVTGKKGGRVRVRVYENVIQMSGGMIGDPLNIAKYIVKTYFNQDPEFVNDIKYSKIDARFKFNAEFSPSAVSQRLVSNRIEHSYEPEFSPNEIKYIKYKGIVINSIKSSGYVNLHNATSKEQMEQMYALAKEFLQRLGDKNLLTITNAPPVTPQKKKKKVVNFDANAAVTNLVVGKKMCKDYSVAEIKSIANVLGIQLKGEKKVEICKKIDYTLKGRRNALKAEALPGNVNLREQNLYKKRGINNANIKNMLRKAKSTNVAGNLKKVKNLFPTLKANKKNGIPFKEGVKNAAKRVVKERETAVAYARAALKRYANLNNATKNTIVKRVKNANTTPGAVKDMVRRHVEIHRLTNLNAIEKGKIYEDLKNKKNVNVTRYANLYKLIRNSRTPNSVKNKVINWMKNKNTLPTNENVRNKLRSYAR